MTRNFTYIKRIAIDIFKYVLCILLLCQIPVFAQNKYENRAIHDISITFEGKDTDLSAAEQFRLIVRSVLGNTYSAVRVRESIAAIYETKKIVTVQVIADQSGNDAVNLRYLIKRKTQAERIAFVIGNTNGEPVTEEELLLKLNLVNSGDVVTDQSLRNNADSIQSYLREKGYYNADVKYSTQALESETRVAVTFTVIPNAQSRVENFNIEIKGFDADKLKKSLLLKIGAPYSHEALTKDIDKIRNAIIKEGNLAPQINEAKVVYDADKNLMSIDLTGEIGAKVVVKIDVEKEKVGEKTQEKLLPIKREGTLDFSAIKEGSRRLKNYYQEKGYFFVDIEEHCSVDPEFPQNEINPLVNDTAELCEYLSGSNFEKRNVKVDYVVNLNRLLKLKDIRIEGTKQLAVSDIVGVLDTRPASVVGLIPRLGYGRGYTSNEILEDDRQRIKTLMQELGYRRAEVKVKQGVSPNGENLIITFVVNEGIPTRITDVEIIGNKVFTDTKLKNDLPNLVGKNYSRARARNGAQKIAETYTNEGYYDANLEFSVVELSKEADATEDKVKIIYTLTNEGKKVLINRILVNGNDMTTKKSVLTAIDLRSDELLKSENIFTSEQNLYSTDAFRRVEIKQEPAGLDANGNAKRDILINLEEQKPRILTYGGGYSTDLGWSGFFGIRHVNLFGKLQQGGARVNLSTRQQLIQFDYLNPRFMPDGKNRFAPLSITAQYQRDTTITRFFRSTFDSGTYGIVQRLDASGNPINQYGASAANPTINRLTLTAETKRTVSIKDRSLIFLRYRYEDVRLFNIESLVIAELLRPDQKVRISGFGATFVRDTRENCSKTYTLLETISRGEPGNPCRYSPADPTRGSYLTLDYNLSAHFLGANISFQKLSATYQTYQQISALHNTVLAGRVVLGLGSVLSKSTRFTGNLQELNGSLPISERYFAGGSTTIRGFDFESAGPRVVVNPQGTFRNSSGQIVSLTPFIVPFGGNGLAIVNLEARIPVSEIVQVVPFYDGGNVFNRIGDIFKPIKTSTGVAFTDNLRSEWTNTVGLGFRIKTPFGGSFAIDYGYLIKPPTFIIPETSSPDATYVVKHGQLHFGFSQTF